MLLYAVDERRRADRVESRQAEQGNARQATARCHAAAARDRVKRYHLAGAAGRTAVLENTGPPWETLFRIRVPVTMHYRVAELGQSVETPAGRFSDCALVVGQGSANADVGNYIGRTSIEVSSRAWYARGVGLVRLERDETTTADAISAGHITMELLAWE